MEQGWRNIFTPFRLKFCPTIAIGMKTILLQNMHVKHMYNFGATSLLLTFVHYTTSHDIYYYSEKHRHTYWVLGTPLSLVGYLSNLRKQIFVLINEGIWKKIDGDRPMRLTFVIEHSGLFYTNTCWAINQTSAAEKPGPICGWQKLFPAFVSSIYWLWKGILSVS